jgi:hypothetical protein
VEVVETRARHEAVRLKVYRPRSDRRSLHFSV